MAPGIAQAQWCAQRAADHLGDELAPRVGQPGADGIRQTRHRIERQPFARGNGAIGQFNRGFGARITRQQ
ncbi:MAG: hypothetical protein MZV65_39515 [Chromatiales bacterium]|nr:hypothetical protein [Chromatiales bacterium]MCK7581125.1 hypothetical protein [Chromatiales bacterium]